VARSAVVILGGGVGGLVVANLIQDRLGNQAEVTIVDRKTPLGSTGAAGLRASCCTPLARETGPIVPSQCRFVGRARGRPAPGLCADRWLPTHSAADHRWVGASAQCFNGTLSICSRAHYETLNQWWTRGCVISPDSSLMSRGIVPSTKLGGSACRPPESTEVHWIRCQSRQSEVSPHP